MKVIDRILSFAYMALAVVVAFSDWEPSQDMVAFAAFVGISIAWHLLTESQQ